MFNYVGDISELSHYIIDKFLKNKNIAIDGTEMVMIVISYQIILKKYIVLIYKKSLATIILVKKKIMS